MDDLFSTSFTALQTGAGYTSPSRAVTETDVGLFAAITGDRHPQHTDAAWAAESLFGERVAHGLLVLSCAAGLIPFDPQRILALRSVRDAVFKRPVRLGEAIRVEAKVRATKPLDEETGLVEVGLRVLGRDDQMAMRAVLEVVWK